jgi:hypothetical protein
MMAESSERKPKFAQTTGPLRIFVEGVGDVVDLLYSPALKQLKKHLDGEREPEHLFIGLCNLGKAFHSQLLENITEHRWSRCIVRSNLANSHCQEFALEHHHAKELPAV